MSVQVWRRIVPVISLLALAGCTTGQNPLTSTAPEPKPEPQLATNTTVVEGTCPKVFLRDETAFYRSYGKGGDNDPSKVAYQASIAETSRACTMDSTSLNITVVAKGRLVTGPLGASGRVVLPIRVEVLDGENALYSELTRFEAEIPAGGEATQFVFRKDGITIPGGAGKLARIYVSFDSAPAKAAPGKRRKK